MAQDFANPTLVGIPFQFPNRKVLLTTAVLLTSAVAGCATKWQSTSSQVYAVEQQRFRQHYDESPAQLTQHIVHALTMQRIPIDSSDNGHITTRFTYYPGRTAGVGWWKKQYEERTRFRFTIRPASAATDTKPTTRSTDWQG